MESHAFWKTPADDRGRDILPFRLIYLSASSVLNSDSESLPLLKDAEFWGA